MDINASSSSAVPVAAQRLGRVAQEFASLSTTQELPTAVQYGKEVFDDPARAYDRPDREITATYDARGSRAEQRARPIEDMVIERMQISRSLEASVEVAKATNKMVGSLIDETV